MATLRMTGRIFVAVSLAALVGCGGDSGPDTYPVSGTVTYGGAPLPSGSIQFEPDASKGNTGPGTTAVIADGKYQTPPDAGVVGGPYVVRINPPAPVSGGDEPQAVVFPAYETKLDLPQEASQKNFDVPAGSP